MNKTKSLLFATISAATLAAPSHAAQFKAGDVDITLGGYVKMDVTYSNPGLKDSGGGSVVTPGEGKGAIETDDATIDFSARESRIWLKTTSDSDAGTLKTHVEGDFYGANGNEIVSNSNNFRLRHAYGSMNGFLIGQTWTTFMDLSGLVEMLDFTQHAGVIFARQAQVRYTKALDNGRLMLALENPNSFSTDDTNDVPDFVARYDFNSSDKRTHASAALLVRQLKTSRTSAADEEFGSAVSLTGKFKVGNRGDALTLQVNHGALGRYMGLGFGSAREGSGSTFDAVNSTGITLGYKHLWGEGIRSSLVLSSVDTGFSQSLAGATTLDGLQSIQANVLWDVTKKVRLGVEVQRKTYEFAQAGKADVDIDRVQFSARYIF